MKEGWDKWGRQRQAAQLIADSLGQGIKKSLVNKYLKKLGLRGQGKQGRKAGMVRSFHLHHLELCLRWLALYQVLNLLSSATRKVLHVQVTTECGYALPSVMKGVMLQLMFVRHAL